MQALAIVSQLCGHWGRRPWHHGWWQSSVHSCRLAGAGLEAELACSRLKHVLAAIMGCSDLGEMLSGVAKGQGWVVFFPSVSLMLQTVILAAGEGGSLVAA